MNDYVTDFKAYRHEYCTVVGGNIIPWHATVLCSKHLGMLFFLVLVLVITNVHLGIYILSFDISYHEMSSLYVYVTVPYRNQGYRYLETWTKLLQQDGSLALDITKSEGKPQNKDSVVSVITLLAIENIPSIESNTQCTSFVYQFLLQRCVCFRQRTPLTVGRVSFRGGRGGAFALPWNLFAPPWHFHIPYYTVL